MTSFFGKQITTQGRGKGTGGGEAGGGGGGGGGGEGGGRGEKKAPLISKDFQNGGPLKIQVGRENVPKIPHKSVPTKPK